jgi:hypothetical protein
MKRAIALVLLSVALMSQAFAVLRPLFPIKAAPPCGDQVIIIRDDFARSFAEAAPPFRR